MPSRPAVSLVNLGCPKNLVDAEKMLGSLAEAGFTVGAEAKDADIVIVNTCGFIEPAKRESINAILDAAKLKKRRRPPKLLVAGCLSQRHGAELSIDSLPGKGSTFSLTFPPQRVRSELEVPSLH